MEDILKDFHMIMLCGPPYCGKTAFYKKYLAATHERFSASSLFQENPGCGLRQAANLVVDLLKEGRKVVIDDENLTVSIRHSYLKIFQTKVPHCLLGCLNTKPKYGRLQLEWAEQIYLAEQVLMSDNQGPCTNLWSSDVIRKLEEPTEQEDFEKICQFESVLQAHTSYKFEVPCLLVEFAAVTYVTDSDLLTLYTGVTETLHIWSEAHPCGRICFLHDGAINISKEEEAILLSISACVEATPIYLLLSNQERAQTIHQSPILSDLAFLHRLHLFDFQHQGSSLLCNSTCHERSASECGLKFTKAKNVFKTPKMVLNQASPCKPKYLDMLRHLQCEDDNSKYANIPFFTSIPESETIFSQKISDHRQIYVAFSSYERLKRYNKLYSDNASRLHQTGSNMIVKNNKAKHLPVNQTHQRKVLPLWMLPESDRAKLTTEKQENKEISDRTGESRNKCNNSTKGKTIMSKRSRNEKLVSQRMQERRKFKRVKQLEFVDTDSELEAKFDQFNQTMGDISEKSRQSKSKQVNENMLTRKRATKLESSSDSCSDVSYTSDPDIELATCRSPVYKPSAKTIKQTKTASPKGAIKGQEPDRQWNEPAPSVLDAIFIDEECRKKPPPKKSRVKPDDHSLNIDVYPNYNRMTGGHDTLSYSLIKTREASKHFSETLIDEATSSDQNASRSPLRNKSYSSTGMLSPESELKRKQAMDVLNALDEIF